MVQSSENRQQQLAKWLDNLVEILRLQNNSTWRTLLATVAGKTAIIRLDDVSLQLQASTALPLEVVIDYPATPDNYNFISDSETIGDIIIGKLTIDKALSINKIYLRGTLRDLQGISQLIKEILADSPINSQLQRLWEEFEKMWLFPSSLVFYSLDEQQTNYGELIASIPEDILNIEIISEE